jgi:acetoacetyl-CoA synthetase
LPNAPEAVAALLACASIGAVWSSGSPDFGGRSLVDRFAQIEPKVLLAVDGYRYGGRSFDRRPVVEQLRAQLPSLEHVVLLPYLDPSARLDGTLAWSELIAEAGPLDFERVPFSHPLWILYSSGTTGLPKGIVQGHGGILLEQLKAAHLHLDARAGDRVFWFTTTGWMMWNYLIGALLTGASIVLFDGNPGHPDLGTLWDLAARARITTFGTSASYIDACAKASLKPSQNRDLSALRAVGSTGSPLSVDGFRWVADALGPDVWLFSASGGSDVCTAFVTGAPTLPVYEGEIQCRALGVKVEAFDEEGRSVIDAVGELVVTEPMPSMPLYLWNDSHGARYRQSYFSMFPGVWRHGDWIEITSRGTAIISGRSDSTINRGGIRMGTAEILAAVLALQEIKDALVVDVDGWMPLFVTLTGEAELTDELTRRIIARIRDECSPRHLPNEVFAAPAIPRTLTGKALEVPVKRMLAGAAPDAVASRDALANPDALDWFAAFAQQRHGTSHA